MPKAIRDEDKPVYLEIDMGTAQTTYVVRDTHKSERARFAEQEDANEYMKAVNAIDSATALMQTNISDTAFVRDSGNREQQKEEKMPTGIPNKKKAKKSAVRKRAAASVKKAAKKVMKRRAAKK